MKPLKLLSMSILIASVLLLKAASNGSAQPSPRAAPQSDRETTSEQKPSPTETQQKSANSPAANALALATPSRQAESKGPISTAHNPTEEERHDRREEALERNLVWLTAILAGIEVVTTIIFLFTMWANIRAANAATIAAKAAENSTRIAEQNMAIGQRAYLCLSGIRLMRLEKDKIEITYPIYNAGQTPAKFTGEFSRASVFPLRRYPEPINRGSVTTTRKGVVVPPALTENSALNGKYYLDLTDEEVEAIEKGTSEIVFHGFIRYEDIFQRWHDTGFGVAYSGPLEMRHILFMDWIQRLGFNWFD